MSFSKTCVMLESLKSLEFEDEPTQKKKEYLSRRGQKKTEKELLHMCYPCGTSGFHRRILS